MSTSDREEFLTAYKKIHEPLMRFCIVKSRGIMDPKDLANDTLLVGLEKYGELKDKKALLGYLFTTANNISLNHLRRRKFSGPYDEFAANNLPDSNTNIESRVDVGILYQALDQLPPLQKEAVVLFEISDLPIKEIMVIQNAGESSVKQRIKRGREKLKAIMKEKDRRKIAVVIAVSLTTNSFSMPNLNQYFSAIKLLPLPISEAEALHKISQFNLSASTISAVKTGGTTILKKIAGALVMGVGIAAIAVLTGASISNQQVMAHDQLTKSNIPILFTESNSNNEAELLSDNRLDHHQDIMILSDGNEKKAEKNQTIDSLVFSNSGLALTVINWGNYKDLISHKPDQIRHDMPRDVPAKLVVNEMVKEGRLMFSLAGLNEIEINDIGEKIEIRTWDKDSIKIESLVEVECKKEKDRDLILKRTKLISSTEAGRFILKKNAEENRNSIIQIGSFKHHTIQFNTGEKAKYKKLYRSYIITIPKEKDLKLNSDYADIDIAPLGGNVSGNIYESTFDIGKIDGDVSLKFKYSHVNMVNFNNGNIKIYETKFNFKNCRKFKLDSKYSVIKGANVSALTLTSYEDNIEVNKVDTLEVRLQYSSFKCVDDIEKAWIQAYESHIYTNGIGVFDLDALKYSLLKAKTIGKLSVKNMYESQIVIDTLNTIEVKKSKYSRYNIGSLAGKAVISSYEDRLKISNIKAGFSELIFNGKYTKYDLSTTINSAYELDIKTHYGSLDYSALNLFKKTLIDKDDHIVLKGVVNTASELESPSTIVKFDCYEGSIVLR